MTGRTHATRTSDEEEALKRPAPDTDSAKAAGVPAVPDLESGPVEPEAWLALQQTIGNSAVGGLVERRKASQPLPPEARRDMEAAFGQDFGQVQIQSGPDVDEAAQALDAAAFTAGNDIYVHSALPGFDDPFGRQVLSEEVAHVAQGVGRQGTSRVTAPGETAEREAHQAGARAAAGRRAQVGAAPDAAGAVARFSLDELEELAKRRLGISTDASVKDGAAGGDSAVLDTGASAVAAAAEQALASAELGEDEKTRLRGGAIGPLNVLTGRLETLIGAAPGGKVNPKALQPLVDNSTSLSSFIMSFAHVPAVQETIQSAAVKVESGVRSILAAIDPHATLLGTAAAMEKTAATVRSLAATPASATAPPPVPGAPAPPAASSETLTPAQADQLQLGAADPLSSASSQIQSGEYDLELITDRLRGVPSLLRSYSSVASLGQQLIRQAMNVETYIRTLEGVKGGAAVALSNALADWNSATDLLFGLVDKPSGGGGAPVPAGHPTGGGGSDDEDKKKPT